MSSLPQHAAALHHVLATVPLLRDRACGFCQRRSKCTGACFVQTTVLGWAAHPDASLQQLANTAAVLGTALSPQALDQRLQAPASAVLLGAVLQTVVAQVLPGVPATLPLLQRFTGVHLIDSTTVVLPDTLRTIWAGNGGSSTEHTQAAVKFGVGLDLGQGRLAGPYLSAGRQPDRASAIQHAPVPAGALRIADLGFWSLTVLAEIYRNGGHVLSYLHGQTVVLDPQTQERIDLLPWLDEALGLPAEPAVPGDPASRAPRVVDRAVLLGATHHLPVRLIAIREPSAVAERRRRDLERRARRKGKPPSARALARAGWSLIVTDLAADHLTPAEALALLRARWQIELLFKCWKDLGQLDTWRSANPQRIHCELLAKAIANVLVHWLLMLGGTRPDRSLTQALRVIRDHLMSLAMHLAHRSWLIQTLAQVARVLRLIGGVKRRRGRPATVHALETAPAVPLA